LTAATLFCGTLAFFTHAALGLPYSNPLRIVYGMAIIGTLVATFTLPFTMLGPLYMLISLIPGVLSCLIAVRIKSIRQNPYNALYLISILSFVVWGTFTKYIEADVYFVPGIANNMFLILSQCVLLSISYSAAKRETEKLAAKTDFYRKMSHDLRTPLTVVSTNIQTARRRPEEAYELLTKSQSEIMKMADMISDALKDGDKGAGE
jgi:signal transduction histidine kinase